MGALEAVLQYRAQEQAKQEAQGQQITQAFQLFQQARQQAQANQMAQLQMKAGLAEKGLVADATQPSGFRRDTSLMSPVENLLQKGKAAEAARSLGNRELFNQITGNKDSLDNAINSSSNDLYEQANQIDPFTNKPTAIADKAQSQLDTQKEIRKDHQKQLFNARKVFDTYQADANQALVAIDKIESQAENLPEYNRGAWEQFTGKMDAGIKSFSKDKDITRYLGVVAQELIPMARKLMEEKGPITEFDVDRVEKGLGDVTAPLEDKKFLLNELRDKVKQALLTKSKIAEIPDEEIKGKYSSIFTKAGILEDPNKQTFTSDKKARLEELRKKKAAGTLGK